MTNDNKIDFCEKFTREELINYYELRLFNKIQPMLNLQGFSEDIPSKWFIFYLQKYGKCGIIKVGGKEYAVQVSNGGKLDPYYQPLTYLVTNPYLKLEKNEFTKGKDIAIFFHDSMKVGLYPLIHSYAQKLVDIGISFNILTVVQRAPYILNASSENSKETLTEVIKDVRDGQLSISIDKQALLKDNASIDSINFSQGSSGSLKELMELENYISGRLDMELGLVANYNGKREYISDGEHSIDSLALIPNTDDIIKSLNEGCEEYNRIFTHNASIELGDTWKIVEESATEIVSEDSEQVEEEIEVDENEKNTD